ncbi:MAG TPA: hypothetical protein PK123_07540 [Bacteroidales bacterium]|nr:hypothetical protein [Bacteroidales bacterium]
MTQAELDAALDRTHTIPIEDSAQAPLPANNHAYDPVRNLQQTGFQITARELLHAIGSKTAALPSTAQDDCLRASLLYTYILDLTAPHLIFKPGIDSDLQAPRSQEVGIGMMCLLANRCFNVPWDQLGSLPGRGLRFDYRGQYNGFDGIFESKGTSYRSNQSGQIQHGIEKKEAHHTRGERFNVELIISTFIGRNRDRPRIVVADPDFDDLAKLYDSSNNRFFRLRHYARVLQFVGLPKSAFLLNRYALDFLKGYRNVGKTILNEKENDGYLTTESFQNEKYFGRWFETVVSEGSKRYKEDRYGKDFLSRFNNTQSRKVFQGMREDVYRAGFNGEPFSQQLLTHQDIETSLRKIGRPASVFSDGTVQIFSEGD